MRLENKVAMVTGVGPGMGGATALLFAQEGADIVLAARKTDVINTVAEKATQLGRRTLALTADATKPDEIGKVVKTAIESFGRIDIFAAFPGGGFTHQRDLADMDFEFFESIYKNHITGLFHTAQAVIPHMQQARDGSIITCSAAYSVRRDGNIAYGTFKEGVIGFTKNLSRELQPHDVRVNCICPGFVWEPPRGEDVQVPEKSLSRRGRAEDIAYAALYLASDESRWVTGQTLVIDGGVDALVERTRETR